MKSDKGRERWNETEQGDIKATQHGQRTCKERIGYDGGEAYAGRSSQKYRRDDAAGREFGASFAIRVRRTGGSICLGGGRAGKRSVKGAFSRDVPAAAFRKASTFLRVRMTVPAVALSDLVPSSVWCSETISMMPRATAYHSSRSRFGSVPETYYGL